MTSSSPTGLWRRCAECKQLERKDLGQPPLRKCGPCARAGVMTLYCDERCQRVQWKVHKPFCALKGASRDAAAQLDLKTRRRLSRQIEKWSSANGRVLTWVLHQQWSALKTASEAHHMILFYGSGFSNGSDNETIPRMEDPQVVPLTDAAIACVVSDERVRTQYPADGHAMAISVQGLTQVITLDMATVTDALQKAGAMLAAPCPNWEFVYEACIAAQVQSSDECNMTLLAEVARRRAWELFVGEDSVLGRNRMPALSALASDATWWRDSNWIDHPEFIEWHTKEFGRDPVAELRARRNQDVGVGKTVHWDRLHEWIGMPHSARRSALGRMPQTLAGWLARPGYIE